MAEFRLLEKVERLALDDELTLSKYRREGERLGQKEEPKSEVKEISEFEKSEIVEHRETLERFSDEVVRFEKNAIAKIENLNREISETLPSKQSEIVDEANAELDKIEADMGPKSAVYEDVDTRITECSERLSDVRRSVANRELQIQFPAAYLPFMVALALAEVSVNRLAFELFFEGSPLASMLLAVAVGVVLVFFAHVTGNAVKRSLPKVAPGERTGTILSLLLLNGLVGVFVFYLAKMRQAFVAIASSQDFSVADLIGSDDAAVLGPLLDNQDTFQSLIATDIGEEGLFLLLVNVVIYATGTVAAFLRHDSHPDYEKLTLMHRKLSEKRVSLKKRYETRKSDIVKRKQDRVASIKTKLSHARSEIRTLETDLRDAKKQLDEAKGNLEQALETKVRAFRSANERARTSKPPSYFKRNVSLY